MKNLISYFCILVHVFLIHYSCSEVDENGISIKAQEYIDTLFSYLDNEKSPGCVIGVLYKGKIIYERCRGMADIEKKIHSSSEVPYYVGSIGKQFIGFLICLGAEQNRIDFNDPIRSYLKDLSDVFKNVKVADLLHHKSGIPDYELMWKELKKDSIPEKSPENIYDLINKLQSLSFSPGDSFQYSNSNYFLLGRIIEKIDNNQLGYVMDKQIFKKLNMSSSFFLDVHPDKISKTAPSYFINITGNFEKAPFNHKLVGAGGMFTTLKDLAKWDYNYYYNTLGKKTKSILKTWEKSGRLRNGESTIYAAGIIPWKYKGDKVLVHEGGYYAYRAAILRYPKRRVTIVILSNFSDIKAGETAYKIGDVLFNK